MVHRKSRGTLPLALALTCVCISAVYGLPRGSCPEVPSGSVGICLQECESHADCEPQGKLCCSNGCGHVCREPLTATEAEQSVQNYVIMAVLHGKEHAPAVLDQVPAPAKHQVLEALGIMILQYSLEQVPECCQAFKFLQSHKAVKSVEYDGASPNCNLKLL